MQTMTRHEQYAHRQGYRLIQIQGQTEWWQSAEGRPWLYNRETRRWSRAVCIPQ